MSKKIIKLEKAQEVEKKYRNKILSLPGVVGISTGIIRRNNLVQPCIKVYLNRPIERGNLENEMIPWELDGIPVDEVISGDFIAY